jgi:hypothetical protein
MTAPRPDPPTAPLDPEGLADDPAMGRKNPLIVALESLTAAEQAALDYLFQRDQERANDPDPDALPSVPNAPPAK